MTHTSIIEITALLVVLLLLIKPLGSYMACVYEHKPCKMDRVVGPIERLCYKVAYIDPQCEMTWKQYLVALLAFNAVGFIVLFLLASLQGLLPLNPQHVAGMGGDLAINTAMSFVTNTNWQAYGGEVKVATYLTDMLGFTVQNFVSAATGMAVLVALIRGFTRKETNLLGNFWVDLVRGVLYILLPLAIILAILFMSQGVIQNLKPYITTHVLDPSRGVVTQLLPMGPAASQVAIKHLGTNGGGFFNVGSAHPFENPTPLSNFLEIIAMLLIPAALCYTFGRMVRDTRQGLAILLAMLILFVPFLFVGTYFEQAGNPQLQSLNVDSQAITGIAPGGNMEGKELRFGITDSTVFDITGTATSTGAVNSSLDSYTPMGGFVPMFLMQTGEVIFGGVGSGMYSILVLVIIAVFVAGLMVGRTPEYLGKKIEPFEMKMAALVILIMPITVLVSTAWAVLTPDVRNALGNPGAQGFSEILYAFSSMGNNNGSAFAGLNADIPFINILGSLVMAIGRFGVIIPILAIAGSLAQKKNIPVGPGTLPTHSGFFIGLLVAIIIIVAGLTFIPALALGPIVEQLQMYHI